MRLNGREAASVTRTDGVFGVIHNKMTMLRRHLGLVAVTVGALLVVGPPASAVGPDSQQTTLPVQGRGQAGGRQTPTQTRDATNTLLATASGTAEISGIVVLASGSGPVRHAQVSLSAQELRGQRTLITDEKGRFDFASLPAGRYSLTASKAGYVSIAYGAKRAGRPGTPIQLADGQKFDQASLAMPKGSVLTGTVVDEINEPVPGTQVRAYQYVMRTGEKTLQQAGSAMTDDRGIYRIYGLPPGDYLVSATPRDVNLSDIRQAVQAQIEMLLQQAQAAGATDAQSQGRGGAGRAGQSTAATGLGGRGQSYLDQANLLQQQLAQQEKEQTVGYAPVYYPGTTNSANAMPITLAVGEERTAIDFQLVQVPTAIVAGTLTSADGHLPQGTLVNLGPVITAGSPVVPGLSEQNARVLANGTFAFSNVAPGEYTVSARGMIREVDPTQTNQPIALGRGRGGGPLGRGGIVSAVLWASADVNVNGENVTGINLTLTPGMAVSGHVEFHGASLPQPADLSRMRVTLTARDQQTQQGIFGTPAAPVDDSGNFTLPGVPPGHYMLRANPPNGSGLPGPVGLSNSTGSWALKSAVVNGRDSLDFPFEVKPGADVTGAVLMFVDHNQTLRGTLQDATGRPTSDYTIIVFPSDKTYWLPQSRRIVSTRPGTDGSYSFGGLPAGDYRITAVVDVEQGEWYDPDFLKEILPASLPVSIAEGETKVQDLKLAGGGH